MTRVWVLFEDYGYEGYSKPKAVFSTKEKAEAERKRLDKFSSIFATVTELIIDKKAE